MHLKLTKSNGYFFAFERYIFKFIEYRFATLQFLAMCNSISIQSIKRANRRLMHNKSHSFTSDGSMAAINCRTIGGNRTLTVSTRKIIDAASNALKAKR